MDDVLFDSLPAEGWLTRREADLLHFVASLGMGAILEVGCYKGRSTCLLASFGRTVHCVDPFAGFNDSDPTGVNTCGDFLRNTAHLSNVILFGCRIEEWPLYEVDFAYLDGDHTYQGTLNQIDVALKAGAKVVAVHDVNDRGGGVEVKRACIHRLGPWKVRAGRLAVWEVP